jgi:hypothetical protein
MGICARTARTVILEIVPAKETIMQTRIYHSTKAGNFNKYFFRGEGEALRGLK